MRIRATCMHCERDFLLFSLYTAPAAHADRCPNCGRHLGVPHIRVAAEQADLALRTLVSTLEGLAGHNPSFRVRRDSVLEPLTGALDAIAEPEAPAAREAPSRGNRWTRRREAVAA